MSFPLPGTPRARLTTIVVVAVVLGMGLGTGSTLAAFTGQTSNTSAFAAAPDWLPPTVTASVVAPVGAGVVPLRPGVSYYVYALVTDAGGTPSGPATVTANMSTVTVGATGVTLTAGTYVVGGTTYGWRSGALTAGAGLTSGSYAYSHTSTDGAGNTSGIQPGFSVTVDATAPTAVDVQGTNTSGGVVGRPDAGDTLTFTYSEEIAPNSVLAGWNGSATPVVVRFFRSGGSRPMTIRNAANTAQLPLGTTTVSTHAGNGATVDFLSSSMVHSGDTITITLGTVSGAPQTAAAHQMSWVPSATVTDPAGNAGTTATVLEGGASDADF